MIEYCLATTIKGLGRERKAMDVSTMKHNLACPLFCNKHRRSDSERIKRQSVATKTGFEQLLQNQTRSKPSSAHIYKQLDTKFPSLTAVWAIAINPIAQLLSYGMAVAYTALRAPFIFPQIAVAGILPFAALSALAKLKTYENNKSLLKTTPRIR